jgi:hypothetical protein
MAVILRIFFFYSDPSDLFPGRDSSNLAFDSDCTSFAPGAFGEMAKTVSQATVKMYASSSPSVSWQRFLVPMSTIHF